WAKMEVCRRRPAPESSNVDMHALRESARLQAALSRAILHACQIMAAYGYPAAPMSPMTHTRAYARD
ncbi:hypothetical protein FRC11_012573, partial [Ceratobasidium sp. 423]